MPGSGKSVVGEKLANRLGWQFLDTDVEIETLLGMKVSEIFEDRGEAGFRAEESRVLGRAAASMQPCVVAVGGGAVLDPVSRKRLAESGSVVWLKASPEVLYSRLGDNAQNLRPLLKGDVLAVLERIEAFRRPMYTALSDLTVDVDSFSEGEAVEAILSQLAPLGILSASERNQPDSLWKSEN